MASGRKSLAEELLSLVSPYSYSQQIMCLDTDDFMPLRTFWNHKLSRLSIIDKSGCIKNGDINNEHLFEMFGLYSDEEPESVRTDIIECIETGKHVYSAVGNNFLNVDNGMSQDGEWLCVVNTTTVTRCCFSPCVKCSTDMPS